MRAGRRRPTAAFPARRVRRRRATSICRSISYSSAFCRKRNELRFLTSAFVPSVVAAGRAHRHVGVAAQAALFHVAVVDAEPDEQLAQAAEELGRVGGRSQIGLGDDLDERHAAAVEVDVGLAVGIGEALVQRLARVLFQWTRVMPTRARRRRPSRTRRRRRSPAAARTAKSDSPWAGPDRSSSCARRSTSRGSCSRARAPRGSRSRRRARFSTGSAPGRPRQTGQTCVFGARAERGAAAAEDLRRGQQLRVDLETDDGLETAHRLMAWSEPLRPSGPAATHVRRRRSASNVLKLSANICASFAACAS